MHQGENVNVTSKNTKSLKDIITTNYLDWLSVHEYEAAE